ncbi:hypothetical protein RFI_37169 [Reticulomyxa filosa]|uniref:Uncharacterized protein n=1 Tax=Reticulomyxa filosa TaxID=46433 RepID=X6LE46_RETFI|nr:hypothetical protein RFI_37169 [Reticulomyxa filosa]|eukprot:ETO00278.1 hypothetical protein RFI_37169 [Reticulomyxa filosa]
MSTHQKRMETFPMWNWYDLRVDLVRDIEALVCRNWIQNNIGYCCQGRLEVNDWIERLEKKIEVKQTLITFVFLLKQLELSCLLSLYLQQLGCVKSTSG